MKRMAPVGWSRRKKRNGRSIEMMRPEGMDKVFITTPVAAAASVPFSATSMNALWTTSET